MAQARKKSTKPKKHSGFKAELYELELELNKSTKTFGGQLLISGHKLGRPSRRICLKSDGLKVLSAEVIYHAKHGPDEHIVLRVNRLKSFKEIRLHTKNDLYQGKYQLKLSYSGTLKPGWAEEQKLSSGKYRFNNLSELEFIKIKPEQIMPCADNEDEY